MTKSNRDPAMADRTGPPIDIARGNGELLLFVAVPGVRPPDLRVSVVGDRQIFLEGRVEYRYPLPQESLALGERTYGPFSRTVNLPLPVDTVGINVALRDGVLFVRLPIRAEQVKMDWISKVGGEA
jgi:HSP20 family protein